MLYLKSEVAQACGVASIETLRREIGPLIESGSIRWDSPTKKQGVKGGKKLISRKDALTILRYLSGEEEVK